MTFQLLANKTKFTAVSNGSGVFTVAAAYSSASLTPEQNGVADGQTYTYYAQSPDGTQFESGSGVYSVSTHTLTRATINFSSNDDQSIVAFTVAPVVDVFPNGSDTMGGTFPSGTNMLFQNASAPPGWTRVSTYDDCAVRIVGSSAPGNGGSNSFSTVFAQTTVGNHTLASSEIPTLNVSGVEIESGVNRTVSGLQFTTITGSTTCTCGTLTNAGGQSVTVTNASGGGGGAHNHPITMQIKYVDFILASKN